ncbi:glycosyltransferase [Flavobacterium sp.]|uniref:glycosyltransferase n=1 Tax=Flavobacterium sp. TaxID=239 RepID=UPI0026345FFB|nr:glycosyltransferase [Flavobacterium sp.]
MELIRILHIVETIGSGGVERRRLLLCKNLDPTKFEQKILCTHAYGDFINEFDALGIEVISVGKMKSPFHLNRHLKVQQMIKKYKPHIVHGAVFEGVTLAAINGFLCGVPIILIEETSAPIKRSWKANLLMRCFSFLSDKVIAVSPATLHYLRSTLKVSEKKSLLINNGVANPIYFDAHQKAALKLKLKIQPTDFVIGSVGRMHDDHVKRFSDGIRIAAILKKQGLPVKFLLVGGGRQLSYYKELAKELAVDDIVLFTDYQNNVQPYYEIMDLFMLLSSTESFGLVLAEAMLHKLPVIATDVGGIPYIIEDGKQGYIIKEYNLNAIAHLIIELYGDSVLRSEFGSAGFLKATQKYSEKSYSSDVANLYLSLMKNLG